MLKHGNLKKYALFLIMLEVAVIPSLGISAEINLEGAKGASKGNSITDNDVIKLRNELTNMQQDSQSRINQLEKRLAEMEKEKASQATPVTVPSKAVASSAGNSANAFNPAIGVILNGKYSNYSQADSSISGFGIGEEGGRDAEGIG